MRSQLRLLILTAIFCAAVLATSRYTGEKGSRAHLTRLAADTEHACALLDDGTVVCRGNNDYGQLGDGTTTARTSPVAVA